MKQQQAIIEQRKAAEKKQGDPPVLIGPPTRETSITRSVNVNTSSRKVRKMKTEKLSDISLFEEISSKPEVEGNKKMNFKVKDSADDEESDAISDSEPSEDNLDDDQIMKLIPKKYGKQKYIKGIEI